MNTLFLVQKPNYKKGYVNLKRLCKSEGIEYKNLTDDKKEGNVGFVIGDVIVSLLEVDQQVVF